MILRGTLSCCTIDDNSNTPFTTVPGFAELSNASAFSRLISKPTTAKWLSAIFNKRLHPMVPRPTIPKSYCVSIETNCTVIYLKHLEQSTRVIQEHNFMVQ